MWHCETEVINAVSELCWVSKCIYLGSPRLCGMDASPVSIGVALRSINAVQTIRECGMDQRGASVYRQRPEIGKIARNAIPRLCRAIYLTPPTPMGCG